MEIDLLVTIARFVRFLRKRWILLLIMVLLGGTAGTLHAIYEKKEFKSEFIVMSEIMTAVKTMEIINSLQAIVEDNNISYLSQVLNADELALKKLTGIEARIIPEDQKLSLPVNEAIKVEIKGWDYEIFNQVADGIVFYMNQNPYIKETIAIRSRQMNQSIEKITEEIADLDSLQVTYFTESQSDNTFISSANTEIINLLDEKHQLELLLYNLKGIVIIKEPHKLIKPQNFGIAFQLIIGAFVFFILTIAVLVFFKLVQLSKDLE